MDTPISSVCQDDPPAMDFVTAAANLRMYIFSMTMKSRFDVKCKFSSDSAGVGGYHWSYKVSVLNLFIPLQVHIHIQGNVWSLLVDLLVTAMAGNIIPAIATTNAVIAGLIVLEGLKILSGQIESCRTVSSANKLFTTVDG